MTLSECQPVHSNKCFRRNVYIDIVSALLPTNELKGHRARQRTKVIALLVPLEDGMSCACATKTISDIGTCVYNHYSMFDTRFIRIQVDYLVSSRCVAKSAQCVHKFTVSRLHIVSTHVFMLHQLSWSCKAIAFTVIMLCLISLSFF